MALSQTSLKARMKTELEAALGTQFTGYDWLDKFCNAMAKACIDEIQQNARVTTTGVISVAVSGVQTGPSTVNATGNITDGRIL